MTTKTRDELVAFQVHRLCDMILCDTEDEFHAAKRDVEVTREELARLNAKHLHRTLTTEEVLEIDAMRGLALARDVAKDFGITKFMVRSIWNRWSYRTILIG